MWTDLATETDLLASTLHEMAAAASAAKHRTKMAVSRAEELEVGDRKLREEKRRLKGALEEAKQRADAAEAARAFEKNRADIAERKCDALQHRVGTAATLFHDLKHVLRNSEAQVADLKRALAFLSSGHSSSLSPVQKHQHQPSSEAEVLGLSLPRLQHRHNRSPREDRKKRGMTQGERAEKDAAEAQEQQVRYALLTLANVEAAIERAALCLANGTATS